MKVTYYIPRGVIRGWPVARVMAPVGLTTEVDTAPVFRPAVAYIPVYTSLEDLIAAHGAVLFDVATGEVPC